MLVLSSFEGIFSNKAGARRQYQDTFLFISFTTFTVSFFFLARSYNEAAYITALRFQLQTVSPLSLRIVDAHM